MARLTVFNSVSLDGFFTSPDGDIGWAHDAGDDPEWQAFVADNAKGGGVLLFGRVTYQMMASYWPTPAAKRDMPEVADGMNSRTKYVVSRTLDRVDWANTTLLEGDLVTEVARLKSETRDIVILGSGSVVAQLTDAGLIDEYQMAFLPVVLGAGRTMFDGIAGEIKLRLISTRAFRNGNVVSRYRP